MTFVLNIAQHMTLMNRYNNIHNILLWIVILTLCLQISELEDMWLGQEQLLRHTLDDVEFKVHHMIVT